MKNQYLQTIFRSFYSAHVYRHALLNWRGFGLKYLFIVNLLVAAIISAGWMWNIRNINTTSLADKVMGFLISQPDLTFEENINRSFNILHQLPPMHLDSGRIVTKNPRPYSIIDPVSNRDIAIIDTTGKNINLTGADASFLLTETQLFMRNRGDEKNAKGSMVFIRDIIKRLNIDEEKINETLFIIEQIPPFSLKNGKIITADNKTIIIHSRSGGELAQIGPDAQLYDDTMLAIGQEEIAYRQEPKKEVKYIKTTDITELNMLGFVKSLFAEIRYLTLLAMPIIAFPFVAITSFLLTSTILAFYSAAGYVLVNMLKKDQFIYAQIVRITVVAITPAIVMYALLPKITPNQDVIYLLFSIGYFYYAIKSVTTGRV